MTIRKMLVMLVFVFTTSNWAIAPANAENFAQECLETNPYSDACVKTYVYYWLIPQLEKELSKYLDGKLVLVPIAPCNPINCDPSPVDHLAPWVLDDRLKVRAEFGDPSPQPSINQINIDYQAIQQAVGIFKEGLSSTLKNLKY